MAETTTGRKAGYGEEDFSAGGFSQGRLKVTTYRVVANPKDSKGTSHKGVTGVLKGRDAAGGEQSLWISFGGDPAEQDRKYKPLEGGKALGLRTDSKPGKGSKYGLFMKSLREVGFPMARFAKMDFAALDGCTLDLDSALMDVGAVNEANIKREGKNHPTYFFVTGFKLPGAAEVEPDGEAADDEAVAVSAEDELKAFVAKAVAKAGEPVAMSVLKSTLAAKYEEDDRLEAMVTLLKFAWCEAAGFAIDKTAKTVGAGD